MERTMEMMVQLQQQMATILQQQKGPRITVAYYQEGEDIQDFLTTSERTKARHDINEPEWVNRLIPLLTGKGRAACNEVDAQTDCYPLKEAILEKFKVTPQARKVRFRQMKKQEKLSPNLYSLLHSSNGITPQMFGLPKIHKPDVHLRPIVSFYSSPSYQLSKYLCCLLSPLVGNTPAHIRNSSDFFTFINTQHLGEEILVSFDVVSLFTKVPIVLAIYVARDRLQEDNTLEDRIALSINDIIQLLEFCLKATYFSFRGQMINKFLELLWVPLCP